MRFLILSFLMRFLILSVFSFVCLFVLVYLKNNASNFVILVSYVELLRGQIDYLG